MSVRRLTAAVVASTPILEAFFRRRVKNHLTVIAYHRICPLPGEEYPFDEDVISATPEEFVRELQYFRRHLDVLRVQDLVDSLAGKRTLPERPAVITFDDGYRDNAEIATPLLREAGLTACFFLATRIVGSETIPWWDQIACCMKLAKCDQVPSPFDGDDPPYDLQPAQRTASIRRYLRRIKQTPWPRAMECVAELRERTGVTPEEYATEPLFMTWDAARGMHTAGMELGGHTRNHPVVSQIQDAETLRDEIAGCYADIEMEIGHAPLAFAYPIGSEQAMSAAGDHEIQRAGFQVSFSYVHTLAHMQSKLIRVPRLSSEFRDDHQAFRIGMARAARR
jgi:peptidoglycan/xylan/chitin deacetylase (PgdA/CDA1 family)